MKPAVKTAKAASVLLVDENAARRSERAIVLLTHGYEVECAASYEEAQRECRANKPDLLLIGITHPAEAPFAKHHDFIFDPQQALGFLLNEGQELCALQFDGKLLSPREGPDDFLARVEMLLNRRATVRVNVVANGRLQ